MDQRETVNRRIAANILMDELARVRPATTGPQLAEFRALDEEHPQRRLLGGRALRAYRRATGAKGDLHSGKFREWVKQWIADHKDEINFARLIVSILTLLLMI
jgi:hypothetical protein